MRVSIIGSGYVGLVSAACFADRGIDVVCVDVDPEKIDVLNQGNIPFYEPGLQQMVARNLASGRLRFTTEFANVKNAKIIFVAVGTPSQKEDGDADLSSVYRVADDIAKHMSHNAIVAMKSTVPIGTTEKMGHLIRGHRPDLHFDVCSNPEFLREGSAVYDFMNPDRIVIGAEHDGTHIEMSKLYQSVLDHDVPFVLTTAQSAELSKYASNSFLAVKLAFINQIADLCERTGANIQDVSYAMGLDKRISPEFLKAGPGFGGSCLPKDTRALVHMGHRHGAPQEIVRATIAANKNRFASFGERIIASCGGNVAGKTIAVLGVAFKAGTDDMREAPSLHILPQLQKAGAKIAAFDPLTMERAAIQIPGIEWCPTPYEAVRGADALVILSDCEEFRTLALSRIALLMRQQVICDFRNIFHPQDALQSGFNYHAVGYAPVTPEQNRNILPKQNFGFR